MVAAAVAAAAVTGCRGDQVTHFQVPKEAPAVAPAAAQGMPGTAGGGAMANGDLPPPPALEGPVLRWTLPKGWKESLSGGIRYATLTPATPGRIEATVVVLPGPAGGELANVNRWRGQIGLPPIDEAALASMRKRIATKAGPVSVYDFESDGQARTRLIAALATAEGNSWFVKMSGDAGPVGAARADFVRLLESLRLEAKKN